MTTTLFDVTVKQNSAKRLAFGDTSFDSPGITLDFDLGDDFDCAVDPTFRGTAPARLADGPQEIAPERRGAFFG